MDVETLDDALRRAEVELLGTYHHFGEGPHAFDLESNQIRWTLWWTLPNGKQYHSFSTENMTIQTAYDQLLEYKGTQITNQPADQLPQLTLYFYLFLPHESHGKRKTVLHVKGSTSIHDALKGHAVYICPRIYLLSSPPKKLNRKHFRLIKAPESTKALPASAIEQGKRKRVGPANDSGDDGKESSELTSISDVSSPCSKRSKRNQEARSPPLAKDPSSADFRCEWAVCSAAYDTADNLHEHICQNHILSNSKDLSVACLWTDCEYIARKQDHIVSHVKTHVQALRKHTCDACGESFKRSQDFKKHLETHGDTLADKA